MEGENAVGRQTELKSVVEERRQEMGRQRASDEAKL